MSNCDFCSLGDNGDIPDDRKDLINDEYLIAQVGTDNLYTAFFLDGDIVIEAESRINFCPMCGRRLR